MELLPLGIMHYLSGGLAIGFGISTIYLFTGMMAGASGFFTTTLSYFSNYPYFSQEQFKNTRKWRLVLALGMMSGAAIYTTLFGEKFVTTIPILKLAIGGFLVGFGARLSRGCTSGHGICGISSLNMPSLIAVLTFMTFGIGTALLMGAI